MRPKPYVGITGYKHPDEVRQMTSQYKRLGYESIEHTPMFGVLVSSRALDDPDRPGGRSPPFSQLSAVMGSVPDWALPVVHYFTHDTQNLCAQVRQVFEADSLYESGLCRAVQLNVDWPDPREMENLKKEFPELVIVQQMPDAGHRNMDESYEKAKERADFIDYALVDSSRGGGIEFDVASGIETMHAYAEALPASRIGIAGGFDPMNVEGRVRTIRSNYSPKFFIDAEGRLFQGNNLNLMICDRYLEGATSALDD